MRTCGNYNCKNYGKPWDFKHHSMCPYCHIPNYKEPPKMDWKNCCVCGKQIIGEEVIEIKLSNNKDDFICQSCNEE